VGDGLGRGDLVRVGLGLGRGDLVDGLDGPGAGAGAGTMTTGGRVDDGPGAGAGRVDGLELGVGLPGTRTVVRVSWVRTAITRTAISDRAKHSAASRVARR